MTAETEKEITEKDVFDKIKKAIEADKDLRFDHFLDFQETSEKSLPCYRIFRARIEVRAVIPQNL